MDADKVEKLELKDVIRKHFLLDVDNPKFLIERIVLARMDPQMVLELRDRIRQAPMSYETFIDNVQSSAFSSNGYPAVPPGFAIALRGLRDAPKVVPVAAEEKTPVHGPFDRVLYDDPTFVAHYTDVRFDTRVLELERVVDATEERKFVAVGDGAGVMQVVAETRSEGNCAIEVDSFDASLEMCKLAKGMGNNVEYKSVSQLIAEGLKSDCVYLLSHVTDYMAPEEIKEFSNFKTIIYGRACEFPNCEYFDPYDTKWGFQLASSKCKLRGFIPAVPLRVVPTIDYTVFQHVIARETKQIRIEESLPLYRQHANRIGVQETEDAIYCITREPWKERIACGVPYVGVMGGGEAHSFFVTPPQATLGFFTANRIPIMPTPINIGSRFFCDAERVWVNVAYARYWLSPKIIDGVPYYHHNEKRGVIEIDRCKCYGKFAHTHILQIVPDNRVELGNIINECRRRYRGAVTRQNLFSTYCDSAGESTVTEGRFLYMERMWNILYDKEGRLIDDDN